MKIKRIASLITAAVVGAAILSGCSSSGTPAESTSPAPATPAPATPAEPAAPAASGEKTKITYWQYAYETKVALMDELMAEFNALNPDVEVTQQTFPYDAYEQKLATAISADEKPDIVNLYFGWVPKYVKSGTLQELPTSAFSASKIESEFAPMVQINKIEGKYYTIPTAVRTLGLLYNKDILAANGITELPKTIDELVEMAKQCTIYNNGEYEVEGLAFQPSGQLHTWFRPILLEQFGAQTLSDDNKTVMWNKSEAGYQAFEWMVDLSRTHHLGEPGFMTDDVTAFRQGKAAFTIDGSFRLGTLANDTELNFGVTTLPEHNGVKRSFGSFWTNGILAGVEGAKLDAATRFLEYLTSYDVMKRWTQDIGEIGAKTEITKDAELMADEKLAPFIEQLPYASSYFYVDEAADRKVVVEAIDQVLIGGMDPRDALDEACVQIQALLDNYWN